MALMHRVGLAVICAAIALSGQTPVDSRVALERAVAKQRASAASQQESLSRQRASVRKQSGLAESGAFFILAPPGELGLGVAAAAPATAAAGCDPLPPTEVGALVEQAAKRQDLDKDLLLAVIRQESGFRPCAVSTKGAMGLMQLMPSTAADFGLPDPFNPADNVEAGAAFLKQLLVRYGGDLTQALGAYNAGPAQVDATGGVPKVPETLDYIKQILSGLPPKP